MNKTFSDYRNEVDAFGYTCVKQVYAKEDINKIAEHFDNDFMQRLAKGQVQSRDFRRYACKLPICDAYLPILANDYVHQLLSEILGDDYVLFNFNSHSSLPGSSAQLMHVDTVDPRNSQTFVSNQTNVVFLHIPLLDTQKQHGATGIWPATLFRQANSISNSDMYHWIKENLPQSSAQLERGDVILKRDNCVHAGGANRSEVRRHMITLIFARKHYYLTYNSGMIPCIDYSKTLSKSLPYRIASDCQNTNDNTNSAFKLQALAKVVFDKNNLQQQLYFQQFHIVKNVLAADISEKITDCSDKNLLLNIVHQLKPLLSSAFNCPDFRLHSIRIRQQQKPLDCDDPLFKKHLLQAHINDKPNNITVHIALENTVDFQLYAGNKVLSQTVLRDKQAHAHHRQNQTLNTGDMLLTTGSTVYSQVNAANVLEIVFTQAYFIPSYHDRFYLTDSFFLTLPNALSSLIRYDQIQITQEQYRHFSYYKPTHIAYIMLNTLGNIRIKNKVLGTALGILGFSFFMPLGLFLLIRKQRNLRKHFLESV